MKHKIVLRLLNLCLTIICASLVAGGPSAFAQAPSGGIGAQLAMTNDMLLITRVVAGPALQAGITAGSKIISIDGTPTTTITLNDAVKLLRGPEGTIVKVEVAGTNGETRDISLVRANLTALFNPPIRYRMLDKKTGLLTIPFFGTNADDVATALGVLKTLGAQNLIIDVRGNSGGGTTEIADVASLFIGDDTPLWKLRQFGETNIKTVFGGREKIWDGGIIVLVDDHTYSGGELFASAFQTSGRATIWGQKTTGAATIHMLKTEPDGEMKIVPGGEFLTANGDRLQDHGIIPDLSENWPDDELFAQACKFFLHGQTTAN